MKPGHAPSERRNRQLPLVALQGLTYKEIWGNSSNPKTAPVSHAPPPLPRFPVQPEAMISAVWEANGYGSQQR